MARTFAGGTNSVALGTFAQPNSMTLNCWCNPTNLLNAYALVGAAANGSTLEFRINQTTGALQLLLQGTAGIGTSSGSVTSGTWQSVGFSWDGTNYRFYLAGALSGTGSPGSGNFSTSTAYTIGNAPGAGESWVGGIADFAIWNVLLSDAEMAALGAGVRPYMIRQGSIVRWLPLDGLSSPEPDLSGNAATGTVSGATAANGPPITLFTAKSPAFFPVVASASPVHTLPLMGVGRGAIPLLGAALLAKNPTVSRRRIVAPLDNDD